LVTVRFLGSGDAFGSGGRFNTCIHVAARSASFLIDCGASSLIAMKRFGVDAANIGLIVISHLHGDHFGGIPFLIRETQIARRRSAPLVIVGPPSTEERVYNATEILFPGAMRQGVSFPLKYVALVPYEPNLIGPLIVTPYPALHTPGTEAHALRIEIEGRVIGYSGDTEWTDALIKVAEDADLFISEAYAFDLGVKNHMSYQILREHRSSLSCRRLVVTHMNPDMLSRLANLKTEGADDGKTITL
jgi:ribonuclease BN (tRNA processing enzyme)